MLDLTKKPLESYDLSKYDFKILVDKSGSMGCSDIKDGRTRWKQAHDWSKAIASICNQYDSDGIDIILFDHTVTVYNNVTDGKVDEVFRMNRPDGTTNTAEAIRKAVPEYFQSGGLKGLFGSKNSIVTRTKPVILIIFTDGEPNSQQDVMDAIIQITKRISSRSDIGITFLQVGNDRSASRFLKMLDDDLVSKGAKFDIVDTKKYDETSLMTPAEILVAALID